MSCNLQIIHYFVFICHIKSKSNGLNSRGIKFPNIVEILDKLLLLLFVNVKKKKDTRTETVQIKDKNIDKRYK